MQQNAISARQSLPPSCAPVADAYEATGRAVFVRRNRNGSLRVTLNGGRELTVHDATRKMESFLTITGQWPRG